MLRIADTLAESAFMPTDVRRCPMKLTEVTACSNLSGILVRCHATLHLSSSLLTRVLSDAVASLRFSPFPMTRTSSATQSTPGRLDRAARTRLPKISDETLSPKGSLFQMNLPKAVWKQVSLRDSLSNGMCQYPCRRSHFVKT